MEENKENWIKRFSERWQKPYWKNKLTGETTWKRPAWMSSSPNVVGDPPISPESVSSPSVSPPVSPPASTTVTLTLSPTHAWVERFCEKRGKKYWKNSVTGEATWKNPESSIDSHSHDS